MQAKGQQRALRIAQRKARIGGRPAAVVEQQARRKRCTLRLRDPGLAHGHAGGRGVKYHGRHAINGGIGETEWIAGKTRLGAAVRRHRRRPAHRIDEQQCRKTVRGEQFAMRANAPHMTRVAQGSNRHPKLARTRRSRGQHHARGRVAETAMTVIHQHRVEIADLARRTIEKQPAAAHAAKVQGQHADAVAVVPHQICIDQMVGNNSSLRGRTAGRLQDRENKGAQA